MSRAAVVRARATLYTEQLGSTRAVMEVDDAGVRFSAPWVHRQREYEAIPWASVRLWRTSALVQLDLRLGSGRKAQIEIGYASAECDTQLSVMTSAKVAAAATMLATASVDNKLISNDK